MVEFDPGPPPKVADHFDRVPSYAAHQDLFWYDWGPIFYRGRLDGRPGCSASPLIPGRRSGSRAVRSSGTPANASRAFSASSASPGATCASTPMRTHYSRRTHGRDPDLSEPEQRSWRNELFSMIIGPALQAIVTFGLQAGVAAEQWTDARGHDQEVPHPSSRDATKLITEWRSAVADLRTSSPRTRAGTILGQLRRQVLRKRLRTDSARRPPVRSTQLAGRRFPRSPVASETSQHSRTRRR